MATWKRNRMLVYAKVTKNNYHDDNKNKDVNIQKFGAYLHFVYENLEAQRAQYAERHASSFLV